MISISLPYFIAFFGALALTLVLTPIVRELNRAIGMVDKPDPRRINKVPIPRGGGMALVLGVGISYGLFVWLTGRPALQGVENPVFLKMAACALFIALVGIIDDRFSLPPKVKLLGQIIAAVGVWAWAGLGFHTLCPSIPMWLDCVLTVFWIVGAVNAFNLIDGLDGLASGIALIATLGMGVSLFFSRNPQTVLFYCAFAGGLLGFLRYNYNPASVFLGDCGSMFIGFTLSVLPLASQAPNSFLVSVGVPMLAMGVPIFDTSLAIIRRTLRRILRRREEGVTGNDKVMTADADHLHHRILRASGLNQRKAAWILYATSLFLVTVGLSGVFVKSRSAGLWLLAVAIISVIVVKDASRIELFDAGRLLNSIARDSSAAPRRRRARLAVPFFLAFDTLAQIGIFVLLLHAFDFAIDRSVLRVMLPAMVFSILVANVFFRVYVTAWSRAMISNFVRLFCACAAGGVAGTVIVYLTLPDLHDFIPPIIVAYVIMTFTALTIIRVLRPVIRDLFYALDCSRLKARKDVSRILVYGSGLRYRAFRRELVRSTSDNRRMIVGLLDDDILLRGHYIGGMQIKGTINQAPEIINELNVDTVVIACVLKEDWEKVVLDILRPTGVKIVRFGFTETEL